MEGRFSQVHGGRLADDASRIGAKPRAAVPAWPAPFGCPTSDVSITDQERHGFRLNGAMPFGQKRQPFRRKASAVSA